MSAETRKQRRELRRINRNERKLAFGKFLEAIMVFKDLDLKEKLPYKEKFKQVWPAVKPTLEFAIILRFTGEKFDMTAKQIVVAGDILYGNQLSEPDAIDFLAKLSSVWENIDTVLEIVKVASDDKTDAVLDKIIEIGDWLFEREN
jgi:hypothetical protein